MGIKCKNCQKEIPEEKWQKVKNSLGTYCRDCYEIAKIHEQIEIGKRKLIN